MIPAQNIVAWGNVVPWADQRQVEQGLIISRVLVEIFSDEMLRDGLRFRGGTALNKLQFPAPLRYSEDIDLVRTSAGPIGPILDGLRVVLEPWMGRAQFDRSPVAPKFRFRVEAEDGSGVPIRLKIEINTREIEAFDAPAALPLKVTNPWFSGEAAIPTFSREEMLATKLRALLQRDKGRDLYDLAHALKVFEGLDVDRVIAMFGALPRPIRPIHLSSTGPGAHVRQAGAAAPLARHPPIAAGSPGGSSDGGVDSRVVPLRVHDPCQSASWRTMEEDAGHEGQVRYCMVNKMEVPPAAAGSGARMRIDKLAEQGIGGRS